MEKKYKDIRIVRCQPKSREGSVDRPQELNARVNGYFNGTAYETGANKLFSGGAPASLGSQSCNGVKNNDRKYVNGLTKSVINGTAYDSGCVDYFKAVKHYSNGLAVHNEFGTLQNKPDADNAVATHGIITQPHTAATNGIITQLHTAATNGIITEPHTAATNGIITQPHTAATNGTITQPHTAATNGIITQPHTAATNGIITQPHTAATNGIITQPHTAATQGVITQPHTAATNGITKPHTAATTGIITKPHTAATTGIITKPATANFTDANCFFTPHTANTTGTNGITSNSADRVSNDVTVSIPPINHNIINGIPHKGIKYPAFGVTSDAKHKNSLLSDFRNNYSNTDNTFDGLSGSTANKTSNNSSLPSAPNTNNACSSRAAVPLSPQLTRKISAPSAITISPGGGFHCAGRIPRDDYLPEYVKRLESANGAGQARANAVTSVPVSPYCPRKYLGTPGGVPGNCGTAAESPRWSVTAEGRGGGVAAAVKPIGVGSERSRNTPDRRLQDWFVQQGRQTSWPGCPANPCSSRYFRGESCLPTLVRCDSDGGPDYDSKTEQLPQHKSLPSSPECLYPSISQRKQRHASLANSNYLTGSCNSGISSSNTSRCDYGHRNGLDLEPSHPLNPFNRSIPSTTPLNPSRSLDKIGNRSSNIICKKKKYSFPSCDNGTSDHNTEVVNNGAMSDGGGEVTPRDLLMMLQSVKPNVGVLPGYEMDRTPRYLAGVCMDECFPGLYIGDIGAAKDRAYLHRVGITHVLNTAEGSNICTVDTGAEYYRHAGIQYLGLQLLDVPSANIAQYFERGAAFIDECLSGGGKVLVHCFMGISRSATIAAAFLMLRRGMTALQALRQLRQRRAIYPNDGFLHQLVALDHRLRKERAKTAA